MQSETTINNFKTEEEACRFFNSKIIDSGLFKMYEEVDGKIIYHRHWKEDKRNIRIDRILFPNERLIGKGWKLGIIGVEIKNSGLKIGQPLAQSTDYLDAVWFITKAELAVHLSHVFLFPCGELHNNMASVCAQSHLGQFEITPYFIRIKTGESTLFYYDYTRDKISCSENKNGKRIGSR
jgi:hypothetical protein